MSDVRSLCGRASQETGEIVVVANDNCPGQIVISGSDHALDRALALATEAGAKRAVKLAVSVAVHSPLMESAGQEFAAAVEATSIQDPKIPVVGKVTAKPLTDAAAIQDELKRQITSSVLWTGSVQTMLENGVDNFVELGPGGVLVGLVKRIDRTANRVSIETPEALSGPAPPTPRSPRTPPSRRRLPAWPTWPRASATRRSGTAGRWAVRSPTRTRRPTTRRRSWRSTPRS
jgi:[acyl-carrier-protein] S-malonyltransferase